MLRAAAPLASELVALLGPTNTGKTHHCIERMLDHESGMIGLPLRLLAREVYDKVSARIGQQRVALITGEEKRVPPRPDYWICTVEAMPLDVEVDFLAVDEIQMIAHPSRGHVFTHRLLHARGIRETWFLGSHTAWRLIRHLVPTIKVNSKPRLSSLRHRGRLGLGQLPPRSAVVAFTSAQVYEMAERIKHRRGGAAVVLGALSPRTRNAQVAMYQSGEVDYLVATDAIGMGLNMSVSHVAFHSLEKFDGRHCRALSVPELAQIAGRAGRHLNDGSFGTLAPCAPLSDDVARAIENHRFESDRHAVWRNHDLNTDDLDALIDSLHAPPPRPGLRSLAGADDSNALTSLAQRPWLRRAANCRERVDLLWQVCQIPDYRKLLPEAHVELLGSIYAQLTGPGECLGGRWLSERIERLDDDQGDIDTLLGRLAFTRTWTYVSHQTRWLQRAKHWQQRTRDIEDRLSDALHERLMQRFVERRRGHLRTTQPGQRSGARSAGSPIAPGHAFASLMQLRDELDGRTPQQPSIDILVDAAHECFTLDPQGRIAVEGTPVGVLRRGTSVLHPEVSVASEFSGGDALRLERRLRAFAKDAVGQLLGNLAEDRDASAPERGLLYQLRAGLGLCTKVAAETQLKSLSSEARARLTRRGIRTGRRFIYCPDLVQGDAMRMRAALLSVYHSRNFGPLAEGPRSSSQPPRLSDADLSGLGYVRVGSNVVRCDVLETLLTAKERAIDPTEMAAVIGCTTEELPALLALIPKGTKRRRRRRKRHPNAQQTSGQSGSSM